MSNNNGNTITPVIVTAIGTSAGAYAGYALRKPKISPQKLLDMPNDEFNATFKDTSKYTDSQKNAVEGFEYIRNYISNTKSNIKEISEEFLGKDNKEISVADYLKKNMDEGSKVQTKDDLEALIKNEIESYNKDLETYSKKQTELSNHIEIEPGPISETQEKIKQINLKIRSEQSRSLELNRPFLSKIKSDKIDALIEKTVSPEEKELSKMEENLIKKGNIMTEHQSYLDVVNLAKDGKISKEILEKYSLNSIVENSKIIPTIAYFYNEVKGKLPHDGVKKACLFGAVAGVVSLGISKIFTSHGHKKNNIQQ